MKKLFLFALMCLSACSEAPYEETKTLGTADVPSTTESPEPFTKHKQVRNIELKSEEVIKLTGEVGANIEDLIIKLNELNKDRKVKVVYLLIDSPGGSVLDGAKFVSAIEASKKPVYTVCTAICASMAAIIHQYGTKRYMLDRSVLMFHDAAGALSGPLPQMKSRLNFFDRLTTKMDAYIAKRASIDLGTFLTSLHSEVWIDAEDATARKFNDEVIYVTVEGEKSSTPLFFRNNHKNLIFLESL